MNFKHIWVMFRARNCEYFRDRAAFGWNFMFPFLIVVGFGIIFGGEMRTTYKIGLFPISESQVEPEKADIPEAFKSLRPLAFIGFSDLETGLDRLRHHKIDFLIQTDAPGHPYWVADSPNGYLMERLFQWAIAPQEIRENGLRQEIEGARIRYIDWLFPGILSMNIMFSALWGVGFVIVRYRKNGVLKRLKATPLTPFEYLTAQMLSRIFLLMFSLVIVWFGCDLLFDFSVEGRLADLGIVFFMGGLSHCALGLLLASRGASEEVAGGIINFIGWPMMFLSEVWFSIEDAPEWVRMAAEIFPITHMNRAARKIMNDGAPLMEVQWELLILGGITLGCLTIGSLLFSWNE